MPVFRNPPQPPFIGGHQPLAPRLPSAQAVSAPFVIFRDFGSPDGRPWSNDFSPDFGPSTSDGGLAFGTTVVCDFGSQIEPLMGVARNAVVPEANDLNTQIVTAGPILATEWLATIASSGSIFTAEWRGSSSRDAIIPSDFVTQVIADRSNAVEWSLSARIDGIVPAEFGAISGIMSAIAPAEWTTQRFRDGAAPLEFSAGASSSAVVPTDWQTPAFGMTMTVPTEFGGPYFQDMTASVEIPGAAFRDTSIPIDFGQPAQITMSSAVPLEFVSRMFAISQAPVELSAIAMRQINVATDWTGPIAVTLDALVPLEWRSVTTLDHIAPTDFATTFVADMLSGATWTAPAINTANITVAFNNTFIINQSVPIEAGGSLSRDAIDPAATLTSVQRDVTVPEESSGSASGAVRDIAVPLEFGSGIEALARAIPIDSQVPLVANITVPAERSSLLVADPVTVSETTLSLIGEGVSIPASSDSRMATDFVQPAEWSAVMITMSTVFTVEYLGGFGRSAVMLVDWTLPSLSADVIGLIEWTQDTSVVVGDAATPLEFVSMTVTDVTIASEVRFGRDAIGSALEPDEWEKERD